MTQTHTPEHSKVRRWVARRALAVLARRRTSLVDLSALPSRLTMPLRRDGLDPVELTGYQGAGDSVSKIGRVLGFSVWLVKDYEQTKAVLSDAGYSNDIRSLMGGSADAGARIGGLGFTDPPDHTRLRKVLMPEFTSRRLAAFLPVIEQIVEQQLDVLEAAGPVVDLVPEFAFPVPFSVICQLLGLAPEDQDRFRRLGHDRFDVSGGGAGMFGAMSESRLFLLDAVRRQRSAPGPGIIGTMLREHGDELDDEAIAGLADGVFTGGYETSASMLSLGVLALLRDPQVLARIRADEAAVDDVVDELLRYLSVVQIAFPRFAKQDVVVGGKRIKAGDVLVCSLSRANRSDVFGAEPDSIDYSRQATSHIAFGYGYHRCVGAELARMQLRVAFRAIARRLPDLALAVDAAELEFYDLSIVYGVRALPVRLAARSHVDAVRTEVRNT